MTAKVLGFRFSGVSANIKNNGRRDLALVVANEPAVVAAVFTRNLVRAAPVLVAARRCQPGRARAILVNSGNANACTGEAGLAATLTSTAAVARALHIDADEVLPASTGVIGSLLPAELIANAAPALVQALTADGHDAFADAICTTDRWPKIAEATVEGGAALLGIAKGAGMIHPDMGPPQATLLGFLFTDAQVPQALLQDTLQKAVNETFNACSVDGDTSTNDAIIALASGASGNPCSGPALEAAFTRVCEELAR
ncbi:MAG TPA: bifunctional ornithine acetyltransferase/N-acetylglutamate synthase, partial [Polyangiaceae bacterium]|nr:bifunctional ornithine acetyltransferase/N-acetylglutamate synthase [Polyangiaceae bacterium]